jgi:hypothetical protein
MRISAANGFVPSALSASKGGILTFLFAFLALSQPLRAQVPTLDVRHYGAECDFQSDDTAGVAAAVKAASALNAVSRVYIPPGCHLVSQLTLPNTSNSVTILIDSGLATFHPINIGNGYVIRGLGGFARPAFSNKEVSGVWAPAGVVPVLNVQAHGLTIENIVMVYPSGESIHVENSAKVDLINVWSDTPVTFTSGFGYRIIGGGYGGNAKFLSSPAIQFSTVRAVPTTMGNIQIRDTFLYKTGIQINNQSADIGNVSIEGVFFENPTQSLLTVISPGNQGVYGVDIAHSQFADGKAPPFPAFLTVKGPSDGRIRNFTIRQCGTDGNPVTSGTPIWNLEVWSYADDWAPRLIAQPDHFIYHGPSGTKDTMPRLP